MPGLHEIKTRIKSVKSTRQITKAMNLVATIKYKKARERAEHIRVYEARFHEAIEDMCRNGLEKVQSAFLQGRKINKTLFVVISTDRGLCGAYNSSVLKAAVQAAEGKNACFFAVGLKAREFLKKNRFEIAGSMTNIGDEVNYHYAREICDQVIALYQSGEVDEVTLFFNRFVSTIKYDTTEKKLLPIDMGTGKEGRKYIYEPAPQSLFDEYAVQYIRTVLFSALLEASASEQSSRMTAMSSATDNAEKMIGELSQNYNKVRQASITNEISEIVGGTEALK